MALIRMVFFCLILLDVSRRPLMARGAHSMPQCASDRAHTALSLAFTWWAADLVNALDSGIWHCAAWMEDEDLDAVARRDIKHFLTMRACDSVDGCPRSLSQDMRAIYFARCDLTKQVALTQEFRHQASTTILGGTWQGAAQMRMGEFSALVISDHSIIPA